MNFIDIHPHAISPDIARYPRAPLGGHQSDWSRERPVTFEQLLAAMDVAGVHKAAIVQASTCYGHDNSYVADAVAAHPHRFTGVFSVDVLAGDAIERIKHWIGRKLTGLRLFTAGSTMPNQSTWLDDPASFPAWEFASSAKLPVCVQMRPPGIPLLERLLERFPDVTVIVDHLGRPALDDGPPWAAAAPVFGLARFPNACLKLTVHNFRDAQKGAGTPASFVEQVVKAFGAERIAWGSNFPASSGSLSELIAEAQAATAGLSAAQRDAIFHGTACRLYPALAG